MTSIKVVTADPVLIFVKEGTAYFGRCVAEARGDDWNDQPYEHNAGSPYEYDAVIRFWGGNYEEACFGHRNSSWSADDLNAKMAPWLSTWAGASMPPIWAGTTLLDFKALIKAAGGKIFVEEL